MRVVKALSKNKFAVVLALICLMCSVVVSGLLSKTVEIPTYGKIVISSPPPPPVIDIGVYWLDGLPCTEIDWGSLAPAENKTVRVQVINEGDVAIWLTIQDDNWVPVEAADYITMTTSYNGTFLFPSNVFVLDVTLAVSPTITGISSFSFDIVITAIQANL